MAYFIWVPLVLLYYSLYIAASSKINISSEHLDWRLAAMMGVGVFAPWPLVAYLSKNLIFDALLYDVLIMFVSVIVLINSGHHAPLTPLNYCGIALIIVGFILVH